MSQERGRLPRGASCHYTCCLHRVFGLFSPCLLLLAPLLLEAAGARAIMEEVYRAAYSKALRYEGEVQVFNRSGARSQKRWVVERKGRPGQSRLVIRFLEPAEVKGVALLITSEPGRAIEQWLYTPAIERARRVAPRSRGSRFYSTDLSFEDLEEGELDASDYIIEGEQDNFGGHSCWRILARPKRPSQYDRKIFWVSQSLYVIVRSDLSFDGQLVKRVVAEGHTRKQGVWTPSTIRVFNIKHGGRTVVTLHDVRYDLALPDSRFTLEALPLGAK
jgi:hypothetical protein